MQSPALTDAFNNFRLIMAQYANDMTRCPVNELKSFLDIVQATNNAAAFHACIPDEAPSVLKEHVKVVPSVEYDIPKTIDDSTATFSTMLRRFHYEVVPVKDNECLPKLQFKFWQIDCEETYSSCIRLDIEYGEIKGLTYISIYFDPGDNALNMTDEGYTFC